MNDLELVTLEFENYFQHFEKQNYLVSKSPVGWQIDHSLKVINNIVLALKNSNPDDYKYNFNLKRSVIFFRKKIPRGVGKAPKSVRTFEKITLEDLQTQFENAKVIIKDLKELNPKSNFKHPYFGRLNLKHTQFFLILHTKHHLAIIKDILN